MKQRYENDGGTSLVNQRSYRNLKFPFLFLNQIFFMIKHQTWICLAKACSFAQTSLALGGTKENTKQTITGDKQAGRTNSEEKK